MADDPSGEDAMGSAASAAKAGASAQERQVLFSINGTVQPGGRKLIIILS